MDIRIARALAAMLGEQVHTLAAHKRQADKTLAEINQESEPLDPDVVKIKRALEAANESLPEAIKVYAEGLEAVYEEHPGLKDEFAEQNERLKGFVKDMKAIIGKDMKDIIGE